MSRSLVARCDVTGDSNGRADFIVLRPASGLRFLVPVCALAACAVSPSVSQRAAVPATCEIASRDLAWLDRSLVASREAAARRGIEVGFGHTEIFAFDANCLVSISPEGTRRFRAHDGTVPLPNGNVPARILSFAAPSPTSGTAFFAMALPSVWERAGFTSEIPVDDFTLGVLAHEISHVRQFETYLHAVKRVSGIERLPAPVNDDIEQRLYGQNPDFSARVVTEIAGFREAARQPELSAARRIARQARAAMRARWADHFTGDRAALAEAQSLFLTLEGAGQWFALQALVDAPGGPMLARDVALRAFAQRGGRWSQDLGLAIVLVLDRLDPDWPAQVYGPGGLTTLELLDRALIEPP